MVMAIGTIMRPTEDSALATSTAVSPSNARPTTTEASNQARTPGTRPGQPLQLLALLGPAER